MSLSVQSSALQAEALAFMQTYLSREADAATEMAFSLGVDAAQIELGVAGLYDPVAQSFIKTYNLQQIRSFTQRTALIVRAEVAKGIAEGLHERDLIPRLQERLRGRSRANLQTIARTELHRAANWGRYSGWRRSGIVDFKEYVATRDGRTRLGHLIAHGEVVPMDATFTRGDARGFIMPPIAPNCRCSASAATFLSGDFRSEARLDSKNQIQIRESPAVHEARQIQEEFRQRDIRIRESRRPQVKLSAASEPCPLHLGAGGIKNEIQGLRKLEDAYLERMGALLLRWPKLLSRDARRAVLPAMAQVRRPA